jgi:ABC-type glycerol-3-phosphate transport system substrate-binding protein
LTWWDWWSPVGSPSTARWFAWVKKTFESQNPGVTLKYQYLPFGDPYLQKVQAAVAAGNPPDCFHCSVAWARDLWDRNVLLRLNPFMATSPELHLNQFFPSASITSQKNGDVFGIPVEGPDSDIIMMNVDLIAKALGWPAKTPQDIMAWPDRIKTWNDFTRLAVSLTKRSGSKLQVAGFNVPDLGADLDWIASLLESNGSHFYNKDMTSTNLATPNALEAVTWWIDLARKHKVSEPPNAQRNDQAELLAGRAAMIGAGTWDPQYIHDANPHFRMMLMPIPRGPRGTKKGAVNWCNMACMPRNGKNPDLAWKFIKFYGAASTLLKRLQIEELYGPLRSFFKTPQWQTAVVKDPALSQVAHVAEIGGFDIFFHSSELQDKVGPVLSEITLGKTSPQAGLAKAQQVAESILGGGGI